MSRHLIRADWPLQDRVGALMSCRSGGASQAPFSSNNLGIYVGDDRASLNRQQIVANYALPSQPLWLRQVHGSDCHFAGRLQSEAQADAVWTGVAGQVLAVQSADCLPVVFADQEARVVAAAHAGWRGLAAGVLENTLGALPVRVSTIHCWLGAAIGPCCFEVGAEVRAAFVAEYPDDADAFVANTNGKWMADLFQLARSRLLRAGVAAVHGGGLCTACDSERFFSYRRDKGVTGRMATLVWRR